MKYWDEKSLYSPLVNFKCELFRTFFSIAVLSAPCVASLISRAEMNHLREFSRCEYVVWLFMTMTTLECFERFTTTKPNNDDINNIQSAALVVEQASKYTARNDDKKKFSGQVKLIAWNWCLLARLTLPLLVILAQLAWLLCFVVPDSVTVTIVIAFGACTCCFIEFASSWRMKRNGKENELFSISNHRHLHFAPSFTPHPALMAMKRAPTGVQQWRSQKSWEKMIKAGEREEKSCCVLGKNHNPNSFSVFFQFPLASI